MAKYPGMTFAGLQLSNGVPQTALQETTTLLERNPNLKPADIRRILTTSATRMGTAPRDDNFGSGLVDPLKAIRAADPRTSAR